MTDFVPEADAAEQDQPVQEPLAAGDVDVDPGLDLGVLPQANEADVVEQAQPGPLLDEDELR